MALPTRASYSVIGVHLFFVMVLQARAEHNSRGCFGWAVPHWPCDPQALATAYDQSVSY